MGNNNSDSTAPATYTVEDIDKYKLNVHQLQKTVTSNNNTIKMLIGANVELKTMLDEERREREEKEKQQESDRKSIRSDLQQLLNLYEALSEFKNKIEKTRGHLFNNEIEKLKRENVELYTNLKKQNLNNSVISIEKSFELKELEKQLKSETNESEQEIDSKLNEIAHEMDEATTTFANGMERAVSELEITLTKSKKYLTSLEERQLKEQSNSLLYAKIKNILLEQKNSLIEQTADFYIRQVTNEFQNDLKTVKLPVNSLTNRIAGLKTHFNTCSYDNDCMPNSTKMIPQKGCYKNVMNLHQHEDKNENCKMIEPISSDNKDDGVTLNLINPLKIAQRSPNRYQDQHIFKLILKNVTENEDGDFITAYSILSLLTDLPLTDMLIKRLGQPGPILAIFNSNEYMEIFTNKNKLRNTMFSNVRIEQFIPKPNI